MNLSPDSIKTLVGERFGVSEAGFRCAGRTASLTMARHVAMYLCRHFTFLSCREIAQAFGRVDPGSTDHACAHVTSRLATDERLATVMEELIYELQKMGYARANQPNL